MSGLEAGNPLAHSLNVSELRYEHANLRDERCCESFQPSSVLPELEREQPPEWLSRRDCEADKHH
jgi:hypothetical protein